MAKTLHLRRLAPLVTLAVSKLSGPRELNIAASPRMHDLEEEHMPHTWNRRKCWALKDVESQPESSKVQAATDWAIKSKIGLIRY